MNTKTQYLPIQSNIPLPPPPRQKYPLSKMKVGDSFFVPNANIMTVSNATHMYGKRKNIKFQCRTVTENQTPGVRVWRSE